MIKLHHLRIGRSIFTVWLLEELGLDYELEVYLRDPETFRAPPELKQVHPLGKSPVIEDGDLVLSESGAINSYMIEKYDTDHKLASPRSDSKAWAKYTQWLHYPEGSAFAPLLIKMLSLRAGGDTGLLGAFADGEVPLQLGYISDELGDKPFFMGDTFSGVDFGIAYIASMAQRLGQLEPYPNLDAYLSRMMARPAYRAAIERAVE